MAITATGQSQTFEYTGGMQSFIAPFSGEYQLEVYGAQGGSTAVAGGKGGYSKGMVKLKRGETLHIGVGGKGGNAGSGTSGAGYNGGGHGGTGTDTEWTAGGGGGGATHIAKRTGLLASLGSYLSDILIVAGGGGGSGHSRPNENSISYGGTGGGAAGGDGENARNPYEGKGGTQTAGGTGHNGGAGYFGQGGSWSDGGYGAGGGGGLYGGGSGGNGNGTMPGGGGSGYIGGVADGETLNGQRTGHGYAVITLIKKGYTVYVGAADVSDILLGGTSIMDMFIGAVKEAVPAEPYTVYLTRSLFTTEGAFEGEYSDVYAYDGQAVFWEFYCSAGGTGTITAKGLETKGCNRVKVKLDYSPTMATSFTMVGATDVWSYGQYFYGTVSGDTVDIGISATLPEGLDMFDSLAISEISFYTE